MLCFHVYTYHQVLLKFLGQMVDALFYIHKQNIFHRNLKPSNILVTGETSFKLCDFGTETLMTDEWKWKIRVEESRYVFLLCFAFTILQLWWMFLIFGEKQATKLSSFPLLHFILLFFKNVNRIFRVSCLQH